MPSPFDAFESNRDVLEADLALAAANLSDLQKRRDAGLAIQVELDQASDWVGFIRTRLDNDRMRFAQLHVSIAERNVTHMKERVDRGEVPRVQLIQARHQVMVGSARLREEQAREMREKNSPPEFRARKINSAELRIPAHSRPNA